LGGGLASLIPLGQNIKFKRLISFCRNGGPGVQQPIPVWLAKAEFDGIFEAPNMEGTQM
jgi:hypothetical protein